MTCSKIFQSILCVSILGGCATRHDVAEKYNSEKYDSEKYNSKKNEAPVTSRPLSIADTLAEKQSSPSAEIRSVNEREKESPNLARLTGGNSRRTVLLILVDGLSLNLLRSEISHHHLPFLSRYFGIHKIQDIAQAHTIFPSLTYPSISSLLTGMPVDQTTVYGNSLYEAGHTIDITSPFKFSTLNDRLKNKTIFSRLAEKGFRSVSIDYAFHEGATVFTPTLDLEAGLTITDADYAYVDHKSEDSLEITLRNTPLAEWPDFIFMHLIGVDMTAHASGPSSEQLSLYLRKMDADLGATFKILETAERKNQRQLITVLTADHGFDSPVHKFIDVKKEVQKDSDDMTLLNEGRYAALFFPKGWDNARREAFARKWALQKGIDFTVLGEEDNVQVLSRTRTARILVEHDDQCQGYRVTAALKGTGLSYGVPWTCLNQIPSTVDFFYPYFLSNVTHYFLTENHPDLIIMPQAGYSFSRTDRGQHGGATPQEVFVPLLLRGLSLPPQALGADLIPIVPVPALSEILDFLK